MNMLAIAIGNITSQEAPKKSAPKIAYTQYVQLLLDNPGSTISDLAKLAGCSESRTMQALAYLRRQGKVVSGVAPDGRYVHYHSSVGTMHSLGLRLRWRPRGPSLEAAVYLNFVRDNPGCTADDVAKALGVVRETALHALRGLVYDGRVRRERKRRNESYRNYAV